jgi:hypothetical protein
LRATLNVLYSQHTVAKAQLRDVMAGAEFDRQSINSPLNA